MLRIENLTKRMNGGDAPPLVCDVDLRVDAGEIVALIGPSGCGKTTLLRMIAGFERPESGRITLADTVIAGPRVHVAPERRGIGFVFQDLALFPHMSVIDNVCFGLHNLPRGERKARAFEMLEMLEMSELRNRSPQELSGGEQQRVALARTLAPRPPLVLLDEPFASLDPSLRERLRSRVTTWLRDEGMTAIIVTHDHVEAVAVADRILALRQGRVSPWGPPRPLAVEALPKVDEPRKPGLPRQRRRRGSR